MAKELTVYSKLTYIQYLEIITSLKLRNKLHHNLVSSYKNNTGCRVYNTSLDQFPIDFYDWLVFHINQSMIMEIYITESGKPWFFKTKYKFDNIKQLLGISEYQFKAKNFSGSKLQNIILNKKIEKNYYNNEISQNQHYLDTWGCCRFAGISTYNGVSMCVYSIRHNDLISDFFTWDELKQSLILCK